MELHLDPARIGLSLLAVAILLIVAHVAGAVSSHVFHHDYVFGLVATFDLNVENNVPTFFSAFNLVTSALLLAVVASQSRAERYSAHWRWLAVLFAFLAVDEDASLHEMLIGPVRELLPVSGPLFFAWIVPYGLAVLAIGLLYLPFVRSLPARTRVLFIAAGSLYLAGALGIESVGGWYFSHHGETEDLRYSLLVAAEEFAEMSGIILFIYALLDYLRQRLSGEPLRIFLARN
jgi:hypothetical protein